jgi:hypothetical protein
MTRAQLDGQRFFFPSGSGSQPLFTSFWLARCVPRLRQA